MFARSISEDNADSTAEPLRVLVVEDSEDDAFLMIRNLENAGFDIAGLDIDWDRVDTVNALGAALDHKSWDIVLAGDSLPHFTAADALRLVRKRDRDVPFLVLTGAVGEDVVIEALRSGADDHVMKDDLVRLVPALKQALRNAGIRRELRRVTDELARMKSHRDRLVESSPVVYYSARPFGDHAVTFAVTFVSANVRKHWGYEPEEFLSDPRFWISRVHPEDEPGVMGDLQAFLANGHHVSEHRFLHKDGTYRWMQNECRLVQGTEGGAREAVGYCIDITRYKHLEEHLHQNAKMGSLGKLVGGIAHDFNNVLTGIIGYSEILLEKAGKLSPMKGDLSQIYFLANRGSRLTRQLLAFSHQKPFQTQVLNLNTLVHDMMGIFQRLVGEDVELAFKEDPDLGNTRADGGQIEQVLMNLVVNARHAMPDGGAVILRTENVMLDRRELDQDISVEPGPYVMLSISDTGCGMHEGVRKKLFQPYFTTKEKGKGTGFGLSLAWGIVRQHRGHIIVDSVEGRGTEFEIYLPRVDAASKEQPYHSTPDAMLFGKETVLVVEDEDLLRELVERILEDLGYTVLAASSAQEAERIFQQYGRKIDMLLIDVVLPAGSGGELYRGLARYGDLPKAIFMSGYIDDNVHKTKVLKAGWPFIQKPFTSRALARRIRDVLDGPLPVVKSPGATTKRQGPKTLKVLSDGLSAECADG